MKNFNQPFTGFDEGLFSFLADLSKNNNVEWFRENRHRYENFLVKPARSFISEIAPFFNQIDSAIRTEPKFDQTIMRINKDMRFTKGEPYRNYFLIHFGKFKMDSEFFLYFEDGLAQIGLFINNSVGDDFYLSKNLDKNLKAIQEVSIKYKYGNYSVYELGKETTKLFTKFDPVKQVFKLKATKHILLQKNIPPGKKSLFKAEFLIEAIKIFSALYPLYCFATSPNPQKKISNFEDSFGFPAK
ncbi:MAG: DUF2461 family protein [bacterium]